MSSLAIIGSKLHWKNRGTGATFSFEAPTFSYGGSTIAGAIAWDGSGIIYADRPNGVARKIPLNYMNDTGFTVSASVPEGKVDVVGDDIQVVVNTAQDFTSPRPIYEFKAGTAPTQTPSSVSVSAPATVFTYPYDAQVTWSNTNTTDQIQIRWYRNGSEVETVTRNAGTTSHTSGKHFAQGDDIFVTVLYFNIYGNGPTGSDQMIA